MLRWPNKHLILRLPASQQEVHKPFMEGTKAGKFWLDILTRVLHTNILVMRIQVCHVYALRTLSSSSHTHLRKEKKVKIKLVKTLVTQRASLM